MATDRPAPPGPLPSATVSDCTGRLGAMDAGIRMLSGGPVIGPAFPVMTAAGDSATLHRAIGVVPAGSVLVIDGEGHLGRAIWGRVLTEAALARGVLGVVIDGVVRDLEELIGLGFPVWARGTCPAGPHKGFAGTWGVPAACGGVSVAPGDLVVGDADGVVVVPGAERAGLHDRVAARLATEERWVERIRAGEPSWRLLELDPPVGDTPPSTSAGVTG